MDLKTVFSVFVAMVMVGSIVGFTAFYSFPDQDNGPDPGNGGQPATSIPFIASSVDATVSEMLPSITIQAETAETDLVALNNEIYTVEGVKRVSNAQFQQSPYSQRGFVYLADISFDLGIKAEGLVESLENETSLGSINGWKYALVQVPKSIVMQSQDTDLNLSREFEFPERVTEAIIELDSIEGDELKVGVQAVLIGTEMTNVFVYEQSNASAEPASKTVELEAEIASLKARFFLNGQTTFSGLEAVSSLEEQLKGISGVLDANVFVTGAEPVILLYSDATASDTGLAELQAFLEDLNAESVDLDNGPLDGTVTFSGDIGLSGFLEKKAAIEEFVSGFEIGATVGEQPGYVAGEIELQEPESSQVSSQVAAIASPELSSFKLTQPGELSVSQIPDPDSNAVYEPEDNLVYVTLQAGHSIGETVRAEASLVIVRGSLDAISGKEI